MTLLHVDSSILGVYSVSRQLSAEIVAKLRLNAPNLEIKYRDLAAEPVPPLSGAYLAAQQLDAPPPDPEVQRDLALGAELLDEFVAADVVVIGAPMYNFAISNQLKAWIDRLLIAGKTFRYTENGVQGLAGGKRVIIASSRGGIYSEGAPRRVLSIRRPISKPCSDSSASPISRSCGPKESRLAPRSGPRRSDRRKMESRSSRRPERRGLSRGGRLYFASTSTSLSIVDSTLKLV